MKGGTAHWVNKNSPEKHYRFLQEKKRREAADMERAEKARSRQQLADLEKEQEDLRKFMEKEKEEFQSLLDMLQRG